MTNSMKKIKQEEIKEAKGDRCYIPLKPSLLYNDILQRGFPRLLCRK